MNDMHTTGLGEAIFRPYLPRLVVEWDREAGDAALRVVEGSLVSVDISGFTALSERLAAKGRLGAEELILLISRCYASLIDATLRHGGDVLKFRGDALLLYFGGGEHELRASRAALEMQNLIATTGRTASSVGPVQLGMAVGVHSGTCHFFLVGGTHRELIVAGPAATATLELEDLASAGEVLVSAGTAAALPPAALGGGRSGARLLARSADLGSSGEWSAEVEAHAALEHLVPPALRAPLASGAVEPEHRHATAAFVKFKGTDQLVADPRVAGERLAELGRIVDDAAETYGVTWLESDIDRDGGKLYLVAGAPFSGGGDEERMLRALRAVVDADVGIKIAAGVNRGAVFAGEIGSAQRRTYAVMGDTVNVAARLCARAKPGQILAALNVVERSRARFETEREPFLVKGKDGPIDAVWLGRLVDTRDDDEETLPLVGRDNELARFDAALDGARRRELSVLELVGKPGIGKSRLVGALRSRALGFQQLIARSEQYEASTPFFVFRSLLRPLVGIAPGPGAVEAGAQLQPWVTAVMPDLLPWLPLLAIPFDAAVASTPETDELGETFRHSKLHDVLAQFLERMFLMPTLFVFEDAHWLDDASHFFVRHLASQTASRPWLVCVTRRPEGEPVAPARSVLELAPLTGDAAVELAIAAAGTTALAPDALTELASRSGGNPLFLRELVAAHAAGDDQLPETVENVITVRIDRLDAADRQLLRCAAVIGSRFDLELLAEVLAPELQLGPERWDRVAEFVAWEDETHLRFRHDLFRAVSYEGLSYRRRRELHRLVGEALERRAGVRDDEAAELLSLHFLHAGVHDKAWGYAVIAGDRARAKHANLDAAEFYDRALSASVHLAPDEREMSRISEALGDVCELAARYERAGAAYEQARLLVDGDPSAEARLLRKRGVLAERGGRYDEALEWYDRGLEQAREAGDSSALAQLELAVAGTRYRQGDPRACADWSERAIGNAERAADRDALAHAYFLRGTANLQLGTHDTSDFERALPIYEEMGNVLAQGNVLNNLGIAAQFDGRWDDALAFYRRSREAHGRAGAVVFAAGGTNNEGEILLDQGRVEEAETLFGAALAVYRGAEFPFGVGAATANLGRAAAAASRFADAHLLLEQALASFEEIGSESFALDTRARIAECLVIEGRHREALDAATTALAETRARGEVTPRLPLLERLVGYALHQGRRPDDALAHFETSLELAREQRSGFDEAMALKALAGTGLDPQRGAAADALLASLGVVAAPRIPLP